jgi:nicotinamide-nucleotide amidase
LDRQLYDLAVEVGAALKARGWMLATAESCTGGWIGQCVTMVPGSSEWFDRGFVTYTNLAKMEMLGVRKQTLQGHGAVSEQTVREMAQAALERSHGRVAVAVSGVAGPTGGTADKPVGTVCVGWAVRDGASRTVTLRLDGDRDAVRRQSVIAALEGVRELCSAVG